MMDEFDLKELAHNLRHKDDCVDDYMTNDEFDAIRELNSPYCSMIDDLISRIKLPHSVVNDPEVTIHLIKMKEEFGE